MADRSSLDAEVTGSIGIMVAFVLVVWAISVVARVVAVFSALSKFYRWDSATGTVAPVISPASTPRSSPAVTPTSTTHPSFKTPMSHRKKRRWGKGEPPPLRMVRTTWAKATACSLRQLTMPSLPRADVPVVALPFRFFSEATFDALSAPGSPAESRMLNRLPGDATLRLYCSPADDNDMAGGGEDGAAIAAGGAKKAPTASVLIHTMSDTGVQSCLSGRALFFASCGDLDEFISLNVVHNKASAVAASMDLDSPGLTRRPSLQNLRTRTPTVEPGSAGPAVTDDRGGNDDDEEMTEFAFGATLALTGSGYFPPLGGITSNTSSGQFDQESSGGGAPADFVGGIVMEAVTLGGNATVRTGCCGVRGHQRGASSPYVSGRLLGADAVPERPSTLQALRFDLSVDQAEQMTMMGLEDHADGELHHNSPRGAEEDDSAVLPMAWLVRCMARSVLSETCVSAAEVVTLVYTCRVVRAQLAPSPGPSSPPRRQLTPLHVEPSPAALAPFASPAGPPDAGVATAQPSPQLTLTSHSSFPGPHSAGPPSCHASIAPAEFSQTLPPNIAMASTLTQPPRHGSPRFGKGFDGSGTSVSCDEDTDEGGPEVFSAMSSSINSKGGHASDDEAAPPAAAASASEGPPLSANKLHDLSVDSDTRLPDPSRSYTPDAAQMTPDPAAKSCDTDIDGFAHSPPDAAATASFGSLLGTARIMRDQLTPARLPAAVAGPGLSSPLVPVAAPAPVSPPYVDVAPTLYAAVFRDHLYRVQPIFSDDTGSPGLPREGSGSVPVADSSDSDSERSTAASEGRGPKCIVCFSHRASVLLIPCAHMSICARCVVRLTACPECRLDITTAIVTARDVCDSLP